VRVGDIMDPDPPTVQPHTPVEDVLRLMGERNVPGVPVVNESGRCVGIITEADLVLAGDQGDLHLPHYVQLFGGLLFLERLSHFEERLRKAAASKARDLMTEDPDTIGPDADVREAARKVSEGGHRRLPVVDDDDRLVGIVSRADILHALARD
jgi:CBS domain-containing protein